MRANALHIHTSFIGRDAEISDITRLLGDPNCHLLTLVGPGGIGKTRLAIEAACQQENHFPDGIYWADLQSGQTTDFLLTAIVDALLLSGHNNPRQQILGYLQDKTLLLVLDNFEQLLEDAGLLSEMLRQGPNIKLLVTSRAALQLREEWLYPVSGLPYPQDEEPISSWAEIEKCDAIRLFVERVRRVRPDFSPRDEQADLLRICRLVEGMPLALELAASWARSLDCADIAGEIESNLAFLTTNLRNVPDRHRSMQAVFNYSWSLLSSEEQAVFCQLSVFRGGFRRDAVEVVAGATLPRLTTLLDKSLLRWQDNGRYQMHELLRQYAENHLERMPQEAERTRDRHAVFYADFLHQYSHTIMVSREVADEIDADLDNIRAAWQWSVQREMVENSHRGIGPLSMFCQIKSRYLDGVHLYERALSGLDLEDPAQQPVQALILMELGWLWVRLGQFEKAERVFSECLDVYRRLALPPLPGLGTDPRIGLSTVASISGDYGKAEELVRESIQLATVQNHISNLQVAHYQMASVAYAQGDYEQAITYAQAASAGSDQYGDRWFKAYCLSELGRAARAMGDYAAARRHFETSYSLREAFADPEGMALALNNLGDIALRQQRSEDAQDLFERSVKIYRRIYDKGGLATAHNGLGKTTVALGDYELARDHFWEALAIAAEIQFTPLLLSILAAAGDFLLQTGRVEPGLALLAMVAEHSAADQETKTLVRQQLNHYRPLISPALFATATQSRDLAEVLDIARTTLAADIPPQQEKILAPPTSVSLVEPLTEREREVLELIAQGMTNSEIAERLTVVIGTVKAHNNSIFGKLGVKNRGQAVARARELNLL